VHRFIPLIMLGIAGCWVPSTPAQEGDDPPDITQEELDELHRQLGAATAKLRRLERERGDGDADGGGGGLRLFPDFDVADDVVVVTARRDESSLLRTPMSVDVVDAADLRDMGHPTRLRDRLRYVPGVVFRQNGSVGGLTAVSLRGTASHDTRILVDGIPLGDPAATQGQIDLASVLEHDVGRIEVLKGAQSGLYGSRAVGGVIDVITPRPTPEHEFALRGEYGSMATGRAAFTATGPLGGTFGYALSIDGFTSDGISARINRPDPTAWFPTAPTFSSPYQNALGFLRAYERQYKSDDGRRVARRVDVPVGDPDGFEEDGTQKASGTLRLEWRPNAATSFYVAANGVLREHEFDNFVPNDHDSQTRTEQWRVSGGGAIDFSGEFTLAFDGAHGQYNRHNQHVDRLVLTEYTDSRESWGSLRGTWNVDEEITLTLAVDGHREAADFRPGDKSGDVVGVADYLLNRTTVPGLFQTYWFPTAREFALLGLFPNERQSAFFIARENRPFSALATTVGAWSQLAITGEDYELNLVGRYDVHNREGDATTFRIAGAYFLFDERVKLRGSVATGFRAPSLFELFGPFGDPDLDPQESISYEAGVSLRPWPWLNWHSTYFENRYREQIIFFSSFDPSLAPPSTLQALPGYRNVSGPSWVKGWEHELIVAPPDGPWEIKAHVTQQRSFHELDAGYHRPLPGVPDEIITVVGTWRWPRAWINLGVKRVGRRWISVFNDRSVVLPGALGTHLFAEFQPSYTTVQGAAGWEFLPGWEAYVRGENLGDEDYEEIPGFTTLRPSAFVGVKGRF